MVADQMFHLHALPHPFRKLGPAQKAEQRQIALVHHAKHVEIIIDFPLHRPLGYPVIIQIAELCNQNVIHQRIPVSPHHALLQMSHFVGAPESNRTIVQVEFSLGLAVFIADKFADSHGLGQAADASFRCFPQPAFRICRCFICPAFRRHFSRPAFRFRRQFSCPAFRFRRQFSCPAFRFRRQFSRPAFRWHKLQQRAVQPGCLRFPESIPFYFYYKSVFVLSHTDIRHRMNILRNRLSPVIFRQNPQSQHIIPLQLIRIIPDSHPYLGHIGINVRTDKDILQVQVRPVLQRHLSRDAGSRRTMMPASLRIVPARSRSRVQLIAVQQISHAHHGNIVLTFHYQFIAFSQPYIISYVKRKRRKQPLMFSHKTAVYIHLRNIVHALKLQYRPLPFLCFPACKESPVIPFPPALLAGRSPVVRQRHFFPEGILPAHLCENLPLLQISETETGKLYNFLPLLLHRKIIRHKRTVPLPQGCKFPFECLLPFLKGYLLPEAYLIIRKGPAAFFKASSVLCRRRDFTLRLPWLNPIVCYLLKNISGKLFFHGIPFFRGNLFLHGMLLFHRIALLPWNVFLPWNVSLPWNVFLPFAP